MWAWYYVPVILSLGTEDRRTLRTHRLSTLDELLMFSITLLYTLRNVTLDLEILESFTGLVFGSLAQVAVIWEEGTSTEELPPSD